MTQIDIDGENARDGLMTLVITIVELLIEAMEREAIRRMESGDLTDEEVERVGAQFAALDAEITAIKEEEGIEESVGQLRNRLDGLVADAVRSVEEPPQQGTTHEPIDND
ncbi:gas vesicle protein K [Halocatena pleomorpha]|uniref:Gas vesicle protein K n=1 Tax=Halocatena pleomorpha TaxID=1785090 RepID=A0A3P3RFM3_9EURY|nr:gas vesicle protein K [Halocatena pleomorpha]RRJ31560.1 gas vesicle protein K [Halocatena pleomorpha]